MRRKHQNFHFLFPFGLTTLLLVVLQFGLIAQAKTGPSGLEEVSGSTHTPFNADRHTNISVPTIPITETTFYTITDLGQNFLPAALNDQGQVVGHLQYADQPILWLPEPAFGFPAGLNNLPTPALFGRAYDINNTGTVVGWAGPSLYDALANMWHWDEALHVWQTTNLGTLGGSVSLAYGINEAGQVVGGSLYEEDNFNYLGFLWQNNAINSLGTLGGGDDSFAYAISDGNTIVGHAQSSDDSDLAVKWVNGSISDLGTLPGGEEATAYDVNDDGAVVGRAFANGTSWGVLWLMAPNYGLGAGIHNLTNGYTGGQANAINSHGQVVGTVTIGGSKVPFMWESGELKLLSDLLPPASGWELFDARDINDNGQIVGYGFHSGQIRAFLLTPAKTWTIMVYIAGDNNLGNSYPPIFNHLETLADTSGVNILALWDNQPTNDTGYYEVQYDTNPNTYATYTEGETFWAQGELDTGSPLTLSDFVSWGIQSYPADHYALVLDDHGSGLGGGLCDDNGGPGCASKMSLAEMKLALATIYDQTGETMDVLYMAMCLMGMIEDAYQFRDYTDFYVANENIQTTYTNYLTGLDASLMPAQLATLFANNYAGEMTSRNKAYTISVVDIANLPPLVEAVDQLAEALLAEIDEVAPTLFSLASLVQRYDNKAPRGITPADTYADLYDLANLIAQNLGGHPDIVAASQAVMDAVDMAVMYESHASTPATNLDNSHGISIFFPANPSSFYYGENNDFATGTDWGAPLLLTPSGESISWGPFLVEYIAQTNPTGSDDATPPEPIPKATDLRSVFLPVTVR